MRVFGHFILARLQIACGPLDANATDHGNTAWSVRYYEAFPGRPSNPGLCPHSAKKRDGTSQSYGVAAQFQKFHFFPVSLPFSGQSGAMSFQLISSPDGQERDFYFDGTRLQ